MEPGPECPICLISLNNSPTITVNCCNKQFHTVCYIKCMALNMVCPMCRANQSITTETVITVNPIIPVRPREVIRPRENRRTEYENREVQHRYHGTYR